MVCHCATFLIFAELKYEKMKKTILVIAAIAMTACQQNKIGYVDNTRLLEGYQEKIDVQSKFDTKTEAFNKKRDSIVQAIGIEEQDLKNKLNSLSQKKANEEIALLQQKSNFIGQQLQQEYQSLQQTGQTEMDSLVSKVRREIKDYGKANGYTYILGGGNGGSVLYGDSAKDLTDEILKVLNDNYKK